MDKLTDQQVQIALKDLNGWELKDGSIKKTFKTQNYPLAMGFVTAVGGFCQRRNHHPDYILMKFNNRTNIKIFKYFIILKKIFYNKLSNI